MPITNPAEATTLNTAYDIIGQYATDGDLLPHFNPSDSGKLIRPGEPILKSWGPAGEERVFLAQGPIRPGEVGYLIRPGRWVADFAANFTADVVQGDQVYWDYTEEEVALVGDVTNGFVLGYASYGIDPNFQANSLTVDANGAVKCGTSSTTRVRVVSENEVATIKGSVSSFG